MGYNDSGTGNAGPMEPPGQAAPHRMKRMGERAGDGDFLMAPPSRKNKAQLEPAPGEWGSAGTQKIIPSKRL